MMDFETKQSQERLITGTATQQDRDRVLYFLASSRWTPSQLDAHIREQHNSLCAQCVHRKAATTESKLDTNALLKTLIYALAGAVSVIGSVFAFFTGK